MSDRQLTRWAEARARCHAATMAHRAAVYEVEQAAAELTVAGAALAERVRILDRSADLALRSGPVRA